MASDALMEARLAISTSWKFKIVNFKKCEKKKFWSDRLSQLQFKLTDCTVIARPNTYTHCKLSRLSTQELRGACQTLQPHIKKNQMDGCTVLLQC